MRPPSRVSIALPHSLKGTVSSPSRVYSLTHISPTARGLLRSVYTCDFALCDVHSDVCNQLVTVYVARHSFMIGSRLSSMLSSVEHILQDVNRKVQNRTGKQSFRQRIRLTRCDVPLVLTFHPFNFKVREIIFRNFDILKNDPETSIFSDNPLVSFRHSKNIRETLVHSSLRQDQVSPTGTSCCLCPVCKTCKHNRVNGLNLGEW